MLKLELAKDVNRWFCLSFEIDALEILLDFHDDGHFGNRLSSHVMLMQMFMRVMMRDWGYDKTSDPFDDCHHS